MADLKSLVNELRRRVNTLTSLDNPEDQDAADIATDIAAGFVPVVGQAQAVRDFERSRRDSDPLGMVLAGAGMIPVVGGVGKAASRIARKADKAESLLKEGAEFAALKGQDKARAIAATRAAAGEAPVIERSKKALEDAVGAESDIARSAASNPGYKAGGAVPRKDLDKALATRRALRREPNVTPGPNASEQEWADWGAKFGVNMTRTPNQSLGISDLTSKREVMVPGGLEGTFTIPDLFAIKANNFDPSSLPQDVHNKLMQKFLRTYQRTNPDDVDTFNSLNFSLLSPNAPLTQNEFLAARFRARTPDDLENLAARTSEKNLSRKMVRESGTGAALSGGMGVLGTADVGNQARLAELIRAKPEMFKPYGDESIRDVTLRVMNQVPGLSSKTASLGTPWLDLAKGNTSAVDLHMIRNNWDRMLDDPQVGQAFAERMGGLLKVDPTPDTIRAFAKANPAKAEKTAIGIVGGSSPTQVYRDAKTGDLVAGLRSQVSPEKLAFEPDKIQDFNQFYKRIVDYVDESRGPNPELPLFPEQWRLWDTYRGRVEPHEFAHPDYRKLPKQSFNEMQSALSEHKAAGYTGTNPVMKQSDWRKLYYGNADPTLLALIGAGGAGTAAAVAALRKRNEEPVQ